MAELTQKSPVSLGYVAGIKCLECGEYNTLPEFVEKYGTLLQYLHETDWGELVPVMDIDRLSGILDPNVVGRDVARERYESSRTMFGIFPELLPLQWEDGKPVLHVGDREFSGLYRATELGKESGVELYLKDDEDFHGSFKDRAVRQAINTAMDNGYNTVVCASTGNLVTAVIQVGAEAGLEVHALLPSALSQGKKDYIESLVDKLRESGANINVEYIDDTYSNINNQITPVRIDEINGSGDGKRAFSPNTILRQWYGMGEWTAAFEIVTQLYYEHEIEKGKPINIYIGGGSGKLTSMVTQAAQVLQELNILRNPIRTWIVQPTLNQPLVQSYNEQVEPRLLMGERIEDFEKQLNPLVGEDPLGTIVESVAIDQPGSFSHTMLSVGSPNSPTKPEWANIRGGAIAVADEDTLDALVRIVDLERRTPQFVGAMAYEGFRQSLEAHPGREDEIHVVYFTGGGKGKLRLTLEQMAEERRIGALARIAPNFS